MGRLKRLFGVCAVLVFSARLAEAADARFAKSAARLCLPSLPLRRAVRVSCGRTVRHARLSTAASPVTSSRLCRSWSSGFRVLPSSVTQRESSAARAHDTIGAGRLKRLLGARFRRRASGSFFWGGRRTVRHVGRACLFSSSLPLRRAARVVRAHSSTRPLDPCRVACPRVPSLPFVVFVFFRLPPNVGFQPRRLVIAPAADGCKTLLDRVVASWPEI